MLKFFIDGFKINAMFTLFSRITGFVRDIFFAYFLGAGIHSDIFFIASKVPNLFRRITAEGAFTSSFLPVYSGLLNGKNSKNAEQFSKLIFIILLILITALTIILEIFMNELILLIATGFQENQNLLNQIITLSRFTILFLPIISIVALFGAMLNASGRFAPFAFTPIILNISLIVACLFISENMTIKNSTGAMNHAKGVATRRKAARKNRWTATWSSARRNNDPFSRRVRVLTNRMRSTGPLIRDFKDREERELFDRE